MAKVTKMKRNFKREVERGDVTIPKAIDAVKEEILNEVRAVANGHKQSIFDMIELGKTLLELEKMSGKTPAKKADKEPTKDKGKPPAKAGGIQAVKPVDDNNGDDDDYLDLDADDEVSEDDF